MAIVLIREDGNYKAWKEALLSIDDSIDVWTPEEVRKTEDVTMALTWKAPAGSFENYNNLQVIGSMGAGVDHLFNDPSLPANVRLTRVVDSKLSEDMQEFVLALCMNHLKNLHSYSISNTWAPQQYGRVADVHVGILGFGTLGQAVGTKLLDVGFKVSGWSQSRKQVSGIKSYVDDELDAFLADAQILVCLLPLTDDTSGILNAALFEKLPDNAYLINVARGGHLNEQDLLQAIESGELSGAALDVFDNEPLPGGHPFWSHEKILVTPHVASVSSPASVASQIVENYKRMQHGEKLMHTVSHDRKY
jgi:glyoxylate/hydroxypyruvate reductase A